jgi:hypothetical protein
MAVRDPALAALDVLIGEWRIEAGFVDTPPAEGAARVVFEWMGGQQFIVERWTVPDPGPDGIAIIGLDPNEGHYLQHYFDARGVARIYRMSLTDRVWRLWRDEADFSPLDFRQRYTGTLSDDGRTIAGAWEICHDGTTWEKDFDLSYERVS